MQHYGLPTRLLDWTESPLIAAYFATEASHDNFDGVIYALSPHSLNEAQIGVRKLLMPYDEPVSQIITSAFEGNSKGLQKIVAIRPAEVDIRLLTQISVFTLHGHDGLLETSPGAQSFIVKFKILKKAKPPLRRQLKHLGIRLSNIFPDLEHLAEDVRSLEFKRSNKKSKTSYADLEIEEEGFTISGEESTKRIYKIAVT